jgi:ankyrin repeat protein
MKQLLITIAAVLLVGCGNPEADRALVQAARYGDVEAIKKHLAAGANVNAIGEFRKASPLYMAAYSYDAEATKLLIENGADIHQLDFENETALHTAAYHSYHGEGDVSVVALLVDHGSKINAISDRGVTPLDWAMMFGVPEVADLLRKHGGKTSEELRRQEKAEESIHAAARYGNIEAVKQHLAAGADVNAKDRFNKTPLYRAASAGRSEIIRVLIANGAGVNVKDAKGETPLDEAERIIEDTTDPHSLEYKAAKKRTADLLRKHGGKTAEELKAEGK